MKNIKINELKCYLLGLLVCVGLLFSSLAFARVEFVELSFEGNKIKIVIESRSPISFEYYTNERTRQFGVLLEGDDYYPALTRYFQSIDVEQLSQCIDDITIIPVSNTSARLEVRLSKGLVASAYDDTANSPRNFRIIIQYVALDANSPCFAEGGAGITSNRAAANRDVPGMPPAAVFNEPLENLRPLNASEFEQQAQSPRSDNEKMSPSRRVPPVNSTDKIDFSAYALIDFLAFTNKGGLQGEDWLKQEASSELRAAEINITGIYAQLDYQVALQAAPNRKHELTVSLYRASLGIDLAEQGLQVEAGMLAEPFGGEVANGLDRLPFLERSLTASLANEYNPGVKIRIGNINTLNVEFGVFGKRPAASEPRSQQSTTLRALYTPYRVGDNAFTLGYSHRIWEPVDNIYTLSARPEANLIAALSLAIPPAKEKVFNVDQANVDSVTTSGISMFMNIGSLLLSVESFSSSLELTPAAIAGSVDDVSASSLWGSWIFTGERRKIINGQLQRVSPKNNFQFGGSGWGAFEAGLRLSEMSDSNNQKLTTRNLSAVWYPYNYLQFKVNWVFEVYSDVANVVDNDADIVEFRIQFQY